MGVYALINFSPEPSQATPPGSAYWLLSNLSDDRELLKSWASHVLFCVH